MHKFFYFILISNFTLPLLTEFEKEQENRRIFNQRLEFYKSIDKKCNKAQDLTQKAANYTFFPGISCAYCGALTNNRQCVCCGYCCCCTGIFLYLCSSTVSSLRTAIKYCLLKNHQD